MIITESIILNSRRYILQPNIIHTIIISENSCFDNIRLGMSNCISCPHNHSSSGTRGLVQRTINTISKSIYSFEIRIIITTILEDWTGTFYGIKCTINRGKCPIIFSNMICF